MRKSLRRCLCHGTGGARPVGRPAVAPPSPCDRRSGSPVRAPLMMRLLLRRSERKYIGSYCVLLRHLAPFGFNLQDSQERPGLQGLGELDAAANAGRTGAVPIGQNCEDNCQPASPVPILAALPLLYRDARWIADLDPGPTRSRSIGAVDPFRDSSLDTKLACVREDGLPIL